MLRKAHTSPKLKRLKRRLHLPQYAVVGLLESLWHMTATQAPRGDVGKWSNEDIAAQLEWAGDETELIEALVGCGWLDPHPEHRLLVHDWAVHADQNVRRSPEVKAEGFATPGERLTGESPVDYQCESEIETGGSPVDYQCSTSESPVKHQSFKGQPEPEPEPEPEAEAGAAATGPIGEMESDLARFLESLPDDPLRRRVEAQARMVLTGDDRKAWERNRGTTVPEAERPELFRLALGYHADGSQKSFRSSVRYAVKLYTANERAPPDPRMGRAERKLAERIAKLQSVDLSTAFQS